MFNKSPQNLWAAVFNVPQGLTMTIAMSLYMDQAHWVALCRTFVCAYCAGVMLTLFLNVGAFAGWVARLLRCDQRPVAGYFVSGAAAGVLVGVCMNFFMTFMVMGPLPEFPAAFFRSLPFAMLVSAISSCLWSWPTDRIVARVYGEQKH